MALQRYDKNPILKKIRAKNLQYHRFIFYFATETGPESHPDFCGNPETGEYTGDMKDEPFPDTYFTFSVKQ